MEQTPKKTWSICRVRVQKRSQEAPLLFLLPSFGSPLRRKAASSYLSVIIPLDTGSHVEQRESIILLTSFKAPSHAAANPSRQKKASDLIPRQATSQREPPYQSLNEVFVGRAAAACDNEGFSCAKGNKIKLVSSADARTERSSNPLKVN